MPKAQRKAVRKSLIRAALANRLADRQLAKQERVEFYRNLRLMKMRRWEIAKAMGVLAAMLAGMQQQLRHVEDRNEGTLNIKVVDEVFDTARAAMVAVETAATEFELFARRKIYYTEAVA
ncbi:hypothetical protein ACFOHP_33915 [Couchioplanes caeruleus subsp. azureus]|uniref:hypothetical protein n=1 Tax=Couchioplanes caeruleus TaxID=56438 RepID=UPI00360CF0EA